MKTFETVISTRSGLHARPASLISGTVRKYDCEVVIQNGDRQADGKSMTSLLKLGAKKGTGLKIIVKGPEEETAMESLKTVFRELLQENRSPGDAPQKEKKAEMRFSGKVIKGLAAAPGLVTGPLHFPVPLPKESPQKNRSAKNTSVNAGREEEAFKQALSNAAQHLERLRDKVALQSGREEAAIFDAQRELLSDPDLILQTMKKIEAGNSAAAAWEHIIARRETELKASDDPVLSERAADVRDIGDQVASLLSAGSDEQTENALKKPVILVCEDLSPSRLASFSRRILGLCMINGSPSSHVAILARSMGIPVLVQAGEALRELQSGSQAILDADNGMLYTEPDQASQQKARELESRRRDGRNKKINDARKPAVTADGKHIRVMANIGSLHEAELAEQSGADGIGLLRTEFLFQEKHQSPDEEEQYAIYSRIIRSQKGKPVIFRTLDAGSDKPVAYLPAQKEVNPALGNRGVRLGLDHREMLAAQLRAMLRAARLGPLAIMFPMVSAFEEWQQIKKILTENNRNPGKAPVQTGIMIEVPSAALMADAFASEVDFFSIGTNDLTQYTLAMDRMNPRFSDILNNYHPAVLRLIDMTVRSARAAGKWVGVCGELAADPRAASLLVGLGVDELSMNVHNIAETKERIRSISFSRASKLAGEALGCFTSARIRELQMQQLSGPEKTGDEASEF